MRRPQRRRTHSASRSMSGAERDAADVREHAASHQDPATGDILSGVHVQCARWPDLERLIGVVDCDRVRRNDTAGQVEFQRAWSGSAYGEHDRARIKPVPARSRMPPVVSVPAVMVPGAGPASAVIPPPRNRSGAIDYSTRVFLEEVTPPWMFSVLPPVSSRVVEFAAPIPPSISREPMVALRTLKVTM